MYGESEVDATSDDAANIETEPDWKMTIDYFCEICEVVKKSRQATGYCSQCQQYMCDICTRQHAKIKATTGHMIIAKDDVNVTMIAKPLYEGKLVPLSTYELPKSISHNRMTSPTYIEISALIIDGNTVNAILFTYDRHRTSVHFHAYNENGTLILSKEFQSRISSMIQSSVEKTLVFFSDPENKSISKFRLETSQGSSSLNKFESIKTSGQCIGMTNFNNGLAVLMKIASLSSKIPACQLQYLEYEGNIKQRICYAPDGKPLFANPVQIKTNNDQTVLFVLENITDSKILALDINGEILYTIGKEAKNNNFVSFQNPKSLAIDEENNMYIACKPYTLLSTGTVCICKYVQIHNDMTKNRELFRGPETGTNIHFGFNKATRTLIVAEDNNAEVTYYSLC